MRSHPAQCGHLVEKQSIPKVDVELLIPKYRGSATIGACPEICNFPLLYNA
jgi:hypothetical protein